MEQFIRKTNYQSIKYLIKMQINLNLLNDVPFKFGNSKKKKIIYISVMELGIDDSFYFL